MSVQLGKGVYFEALPAKLYPRGCPSLIGADAREQPAILGYLSYWQQESCQRRGCQDSGQEVGAV